MKYLSPYRLNVTTFTVGSPFTFGEDIPSTLERPSTVVIRTVELYRRVILYVPRLSVVLPTLKSNGIFTISRSAADAVEVDINKMAPIRAALKNSLLITLSPLKAAF